MKSLRIGLALAWVLTAGLVPVQAQTPHKAVALHPAAKAAAKPAPPALPTAVRELGGIEEYRLANGLQILLFQIGRAHV